MSDGHPLNRNNRMYEKVVRPKPPRRVVHNWPVFALTRLESGLVPANCEQLWINYKEEGDQRGVGGRARQAGAAGLARQVEDQLVGDAVQNRVLQSRRTVWLSFPRMTMPRSRTKRKTTTSSICEVLGGMGMICSTPHKTKARPDSDAGAQLGPRARQGELEQGVGNANADEGNRRFHPPREGRGAASKRHREEGCRRRSPRRRRGRYRSGTSTPPQREQGGTCACRDSQALAQNHRGGYWRPGRTYRRLVAYSSGTDCAFGGSHPSFGFRLAPAVDEDRGGLRRSTLARESETSANPSTLAGKIEERLHSEAVSSEQAPCPILHAQFPRLGCCHFRDCPG